MDWGDEKGEKNLITRMTIGRGRSIIRVDNEGKEEEGWFVFDAIDASVESINIRPTRESLLSTD